MFLSETVLAQHTAACFFAAIIVAVATLFLVVVAAALIVAALLGDQLVGGEIRQIVERLHASLAQYHQHRLGQVRQFGQRILDTQFATFRAGGFLATVERFLRAALQFLTQFLVETLDIREFRQIDIGHFFQLGEPFGHQQLRQRLVDVEFFLEQLRPLGKFLLPLFRSLGLGHDVDLLAGQLAGQTHVLTTATNRQAQLIVGHHDLDAAFFLVDNDAADRGGLQRVDHKGRGIIAPRDNVDLFALHFLHDGLHAAALHADTGADRVDARIAADHADLGAAARIAGGGLDLDDAIVDFGHFLREQLLHEFRMGAAQENLRATVLTLNLEDQRADALTHTGGFTRDLLIAANDTLGAAEVDDHMAEFNRLDNARDNFASAVLELGILTVALGIADLLKDHLLGRLCIDTAQIHRRQRIDDEIANLRTGLQLFSGLDVDLLEIVFDHLNHLNHTPQTQIASARIKLCTDVVFGAITVARRLLDRLFHRLDDDRLVDHLFRGDRGGNRKQFGAVGGNRTGHIQSS